VVEQRARGQRGLVMATVALDQRARTELAVTGVAALRAAEAVGPAQREQSVVAGFFRAELFQEGRQAHALLKLNRVLGHDVTPCWIDGYDISLRAYQ
jgi:hypothetical protein